MISTTTTLSSPSKFTAGSGMYWCDEDILRSCSLLLCIAPVRCCTVSQYCSTMPRRVLISVSRLASEFAFNRLGDVGS